MKTIKSFIRFIITSLIYFFFTEKEIFEIAKKVSKKNQFVKEVRTINVKKGSRRYTLLVIRTLDGIYKINLGRHKTEQEIDIIDVGYPEGIVGKTFNLKG